MTSPTEILIAVTALACIAAYLAWRRAVVRIRLSDGERKSRDDEEWGDRQW